MHLFVLPLLAALLVSAVAAEPALACTCPDGPSGYVSWPTDGATDAAADTPIVVLLTDHREDPEKIGISLEDEPGNKITLTETERVPASWKGCGAAMVVFLRPARRLDLGTEYSVWFDLGSMQQRGATFTVGDHSFEPEPAIPAKVTYAAHYPNRACFDAECPAIANIQVELDAPPDRLAWLFIESSAERSGRNHWAFRPEATDRTIVLNVMQGADDPCVNVRMLGREGRPLFEERVCQPGACSLCELIAGSTCGAPSYCSGTISCDAPAADAGAAHEDAGAPPPPAGARPERDGGCSALPYQRAAYPLVLPLLAAIVTGRVLRRRRAG